MKPTVARKEITNVSATRRSARLSSAASNCTRSRSSGDAVRVSPPAGPRGALGGGPTCRTGAAGTRSPPAGPKGLGAEPTPGPAALRRGPSAGGVESLIFGHRSIAWRTPEHRYRPARPRGPPTPDRSDRVRTRRGRIGPVSEGLVAWLVGTG